MAFRNRIVRLSQLTADSVIGAMIATASAGARWMITGPAGGGSFTTGTIYGFTGAAQETFPAQISTNDNGLGIAQLVLESPRMSGAPSGSGITLTRGGPTDFPTINLDGQVLLGVSSNSFIKGLEFGSVALTFNAGGDAAITHGLGRPPIVAFATHESAVGGVNISITPRTGSLTSTAVTFHARVEGGGAPYVGSLSAVKYLVIA